MLKMNVFPADTFVVVNKTILNPNDYNLLFMLYQPIIGSNAVALYFTLCSYFDKLELISKEWQHHQLMTKTREKLDSIIENREKLEAIGLIKTYVKKGDINNYVYEIYSPVSANDFLNNPLLKSALLNNVGKSEYKDIVSYFSIPHISLKEYELINCTFSDIFKSGDMTGMDSYLNDIKKFESSNLQIDELGNIDDTIAMIPDEMLNKKSITKEIKDLINKLVFLYNFKSDQLEEVLRNSLDCTKTIDKEKLKINSCNFYKFEHNGKLPNLIYKNQPEYLKKNLTGNSKKEKLIHVFETTSPYEYLCSKYNGGTPNKNDLEILSYLATELNLNPGVINVLVDYVLRINDNKLIKNFAYTIASQWKMSKIETVTDAIEISIKEQKKKQARTISKPTYNNKNIAKKPDWLDKKIDIKEANNDELKEMEKMLENFK